ncbi:hypothetical protein PR048_023511 [Dryococelus australis]|uniref:Uncharacterized protein n=1 Tax=Dryococelus australis TaxID=614101 RepID=A0ABQ9GUA0_9NEOP|nr:hypothetical protein PR048_023511 [Dryococelus australis]
MAWVHGKTGYLPVKKGLQSRYIKSFIHFSENDYERDLQNEFTGIKRNAVHYLLIPNVTSNEFPKISERLKNQTVKRKLVSDLTEMQKMKRHPENSKCEENKNNGTHVVTQELNEQCVNQVQVKT